MCKSISITNVLFSFYQLSFIRFLYALVQNIETFPYCFIQGWAISVLVKGCGFITAYI